MVLQRLISFADITARTVVELGSSAHKFNVAIPQVEQQYLRPLLGAALYGELLNFVQLTIPDPLDPLAELAEQARDMLAAWAVVEAWPSLLGHIEAAGFVTKVGEKTTGTTTADVTLTDRTLSALRGTAQWRTGELLRWLTAHAADYPAWVQPGGTPSTEMALGGLYLD